MKPGFALTLSDDGIRLLHRTSRGWMLVGDADLEDAAVEDTLRVLRKTAAALAPEGVASKLVLPNAQILYTEITAPGLDEATRRAQIEAALAERTPYPIADLAYDWSGAGDLVKVAVVSRLTLSEAEGFAEEHGFNPVAFVSIPEGGSFDGEPFFGLTARAAEHLPAGTAFERDARPVRIVGQIGTFDTAEAPERGEREADEPGADEAFAEGTDLPDPVKPADAALSLPLETSQDTGEEIPGDALAEPEADAITETLPDAAPEAAPESPAEPHAMTRQEEPFAAASVASDDLPAATDDAPLADALPLVETAAETAAGTQLPLALETATESAPESATESAAPNGFDADDSTEPPPDDSALPEAALAPHPAAADLAPDAGMVWEDFEEQPASATPTAIQPPAEAPHIAVGSGAESGAELAPLDAHAEEVPEAPFAVVDPDEPLEDEVAPAAAAADMAADTPPGFTSRRKLPFGIRPEDTAPPNLRHAAPRLGGVTAPVGITAPVVADSLADDIPDALPNPAVGAALGEALRKRAAKKPGGAPRPAGPRVEPVAARPATAQPQPPLRRTAKSPVQESEDLTIFGARRAPAVGGKPRYLGPALIGGLIALIGLVGLWSSLSGDNSARTEPSPTTLEQSAVQAPATPDATAEAPATTAEVSDPAPADSALDGAAPDEAATGAANPTAVANGADTALATATTPETAAAEPAAPIAETGDSAGTGPQTGTSDAVASGVDQALAEATGAEATAPVATAPANPATNTGANTAATGTYAAQSQPDTTAADSITAETAPATPDATELPAGQALLHDAPLAPQPLPLPFGALVKYGADGLIIPSKEGVQTPSGITLFTGKPPVAPKVRPAKITEIAAEAAAAAAVPAVATGTTTGAEATTAAPVAPEPYADPKLKGKRPAARPASLPGAQDQGAATPGTTTPAAAPPQTAPPPPVDPRHAALKPKDRPAAILARAAAAAPAVETEPATTTAAPVTGGTRLAVVQSRRPAERPSDVSKAVESALAAAVAEPEPAPEPVPVVQAAQPPEPAKAPAVPQVKADAAVAEAATVEIDEPEPVTAAPGIPTRASVAKQATYANAIDLGKINLIGIMGSASDRRALIRTSNGRYVRVKVGDRFDGGRVASIGNGQLTYVKGSKTIVLKMIAAG